MRKVGVFFSEFSLFMSQQHRFSVPAQVAKKNVEMIRVQILSQVYAIGPDWDQRLSHTSRLILIPVRKAQDFGLELTGGAPNVNGGYLIYRQ